MAGHSGYFVKPLSSLSPVTEPAPHLLHSVPPHRLSKSRFLAGLQCAKRLYLEFHSPELATPPTPDRRAIMDMGTEVGVVARQYFPHGVLVEETHRQIPSALLRTHELLKDPGVPAIFEGAFLWRSGACRYFGAS